jgi:hypothetical protein
METYTGFLILHITVIWDMGPCTWVKDTTVTVESTASILRRDKPTSIIKTAVAY